MHSASGPGCCAPPSGVDIEGEVWALPKAAIGDLLALVAPAAGLRHRVPRRWSPVSGFLVEAEAVDGARDITDHRGWRAWLGCA